VLKKEHRNNSGGGSVNNSGGGSVNNSGGGSVKSGGGSVKKRTSAIGVRGQGVSAQSKQSKIPTPTKRHTYMLQPVRAEPHFFIFHTLKKTTRT